jgi:formylglycine-generating enzyme required for sulfatase activity
VAQKEPNELWLYDMSGNVWEWCWDWYASYSSDSGTNPHGPYWGGGRVLRGGSWSNLGYYLRSSVRDFVNPGNWSFFLGFRPVRSLP